MTPLGKSIVTFTTDFGHDDHFVGTMKGVILNINPDATLVDICHNVAPFDLLGASLMLAQSYSYFPAGTVHVVVVDPGVGTARRPIVADTGKHIFVAPDNGVLSLIFDRQERLTVRHITAEHYFLHPVSSTFHGRDIFAAIAGHLSRGVDLSKIGDPITDYVRLQIPQPRLEGEKIIGSILRFDHFGNVVTNIPRRALSHLLKLHPTGLTIRVGANEIRTIRSAYAEGAPGEIFGIIGSMGYLELATNRGSAATALAVNKGDTVELSA